MEFKLPTLTPIGAPIKKKRKLLLLSDDITTTSGIATMSRELIVGLCKDYDFIQLAALQQHPDHGKVKDVSQAIAQESGVLDANVKLYCHSGYGNPNVLREILQIENPDAILHFTDPRFWEWLYSMEYELRTVYKRPLLYYNIWDSPPAPHWNRKYYASCDLLMNISQQTHALVKIVLGNDAWKDVLTNEGTGNINLGYVAHGINKNRFFPIKGEDAAFENFKADFYKKHPNAEFVIFWNNRNIRRKQPGDVILAYKTFCDSLSKEDQGKVLLVMHTDPLDPNGTDLYAVRDMICPDYPIAFSLGRLPTPTLNYFYNVADVVLNIASNEGFGLSGAEALMSGTMIINNVTGGLQDQCGFVTVEDTPVQLTPEFTSNHTKRYTKCGSWAIPVFPSNRSLQGSLATPYIFDDRCRFEDVAVALKQAFELPKQERIERGATGREYALKVLNSENMCNDMNTCIQYTLDNWKSRPKFELISAAVLPERKPTGIVNC